MNATLRRILQVGAWALALALVALPVVALVNGWIGAERWPLRTLRVTDGLERVDTARLREVVAPHAADGFFAIRLDRVQAEVARLPWVERAEVRKLWPDVLEVRISEHRPFARWGGPLLSSRTPVPGGRHRGARRPARLDGPDARWPTWSLYNQAGRSSGRRALGPGGARPPRQLVAGAGQRHRSDGRKAGSAAYSASRVLPQLLARSGRPCAAPTCATNGLPWNGASGPAGGDAGEGGAGVAHPPRRAPGLVPPRESRLPHMNRKGDKALIVGLDISTKVVALVGEIPGNPIR